MADEPEPTAEYTAENMRTLRAPEHVRLNPGMYIGNTGAAGLHDALFEMVEGSLAEIAAGRGREVRVTLHPDGSAEVSDDGRGDSLAEPGGSAFENFTSIGQNYTHADGRGWFWYTVASALSEWLEAESRHAGRVVRRAFRRGESASTPADGGPAERDGLTVRFRPDPEIFGDTRFDPATVCTHLRRVAHLRSGVRVVFADRATGTEDRFEFADGIRALVESLDHGRPLLHPDVLVARGEADGVRYEVGLRWSRDDGALPLSYVNSSATLPHSTHVTGFRIAVTRAVNDFIREHLAGIGPVDGFQVQSGLTSAVSVWLADPSWEGATRSRLRSPEAERSVRRGVRQFLCDTFRANPELAERIARHAAAQDIGASRFTEPAWLDCDDPGRMLRFINPWPGRRKAILFTAACGRAGPRRGTSLRHAELIRALADHADGAATPTPSADTPPQVREMVARATAADFGPLAAAEATRWLARSPSGRAAQAALVREVFGNPFRPVAVDPAWLTSAVVAIARGMYDSRDFAAMPILADALQEAGCDHAELLEHCRTPGRHVRGCWVVDLLLGLDMHDPEESAG